MVPHSIKPVYASLGYAIRLYPHSRYGRLQPCVRLIPDALRLRSKSDLVNRILPCSNESQAVHIQRSLYGFILCGTIHPLAFV